MDELINKLIAEYRADHITWHDIQDQVEAQLIIKAGGVKAYEEIPIHKRIQQENDILTKIENKLKGGE